MFSHRTLSVAVILLLASPAVAVAQSVIGTTQKVVRQVEGNWQAKTRRLELRDDVYSNERITTGSQSATRLTFRDQTMLSIGPDSKVTLDRFVFDANPAKSAVTLSITKGVLRFVSGNLPKSSYLIRTPNANIGIRGTIVEITVLSDGTTTVKVIEGTVSVTGNGGQQIFSTGLTTTVRPGAPPSTPVATTAPRQQVATMNRLLGPDPGRAAVLVQNNGGGGLVDNMTAAGLAALGLGALIIAVTDDSSRGSTISSSASSTN